MKTKISFFKSQNPWEKFQKTVTTLVHMSDNSDSSITMVCEITFMKAIFKFMETASTFVW